jgi:L-ascorbate metabolism protein UlaG (beta-lactamase superfamily)
MRFLIKSLIFFVVLCSKNSFATQDVLGTAHYLGNEGVLVVGKQKKILFDPIFNKNYQRFTLVPENLKFKMFENRDPFGGIDIIFISHSHADHFDAKDVSAYLHKYHNVQLIAPTQAIEKLKLLPDYKKITKQLHEISMKVGEQPIELFLDGVQVEVIRIPHVGWPERADVENLVYRVTLDDVTVMHLGDSDINPAHYLPFSSFWSKKISHHAFIPGIFAVNTNSEQTIKELINVQKITHIHIPMNVPDTLNELKVDFFSIPDEIREIINMGSSDLKSVGI